jgi:glycosyltransferase involved in cell wall biosynthesis
MLSFKDHLNALLLDDGARCPPGTSCGPVACRASVPGGKVVCSPGFRASGVACLEAHLLISECILGARYVRGGSVAGPSNLRREFAVSIGHRRGARRLVRQAHVTTPVPPLASGRRPRISVIIPCHNYGRFLSEAVNSALSQEGVASEVIIVDDASTDDSATVAERLARCDSRVTVIRQRPNKGHVITFNTGYAAASGEFIVRLDADDLLTPGSLARSAALFDNFPHVGLVYGHPLHFTADIPIKARTTVRGWSIWSGEDWIAERCRTAVNCITTPEAMVRASVMQSTGPLSTALKYAQDMEMWLRIAAVSDVGRVDGPDQAFHRDHAASMSETYGKLVDLVERRTVFDTLFSGPGGRMRRATELYRTARSALADEALADACRAYDRGQTGTVNIQDYIDFAVATCPEARQLPHWRPLQRRQWVGARLAPIPPFFTATVACRRLRWEISYRRWQRTGLW